MQFFSTIALALLAASATAHPEPAKRDVGEDIGNGIDSVVDGASSVFGKATSAIGSLGAQATSKFGSITSEYSSCSSQLSSASESIRSCYTSAVFDIGASACGNSTASEACICSVATASSDQVSSTCEPTATRSGDDQCQTAVQTLYSALMPEFIHAGCAATDSAAPGLAPPLMMGSVLAGLLLPAAFVAGTLGIAIAL